MFYGTASADIVLVVPGLLLKIRSTARSANAKKVRRLFMGKASKRLICLEDTA